MPPLLALEAWEAEELALAAEKPPERPLPLPPELLPPERPATKPPRGAEGGGTERAAVAKLRDGVAVGRALRFVRRVEEADGAFMAPTRALVTAVALELTKRRVAVS